MAQETLSFQTEVSQLLQLMIHSLYSNSEIFLRELISNSSDALDKLRYEEITKRDLLPASQENGIYIHFDKDSGTIVIEDTGIGMTREEIIQNLGTIASSGTKKFLEKLKDTDKKDSNLIGQFGVGFYSAFMVADHVRVESRSALGGEPVVWESKGDGTFTVDSGTRSDRGTRIELKLKGPEKEIHDNWWGKGIVKKYSDYVTYPIFMKNEDGTHERVNRSTPVWGRAKKDNTTEDYNELYKQLGRAWEEPLAWEHLNIEGNVPFQSVVFLPKQAPFDLYTRDNHGLHLYVKRVCIMEKCKDLLPEYLRFVTGVVETDELPLNVSREILQNNTKIPVIKKQIVKKTLGMIANLAKNDPEKFSDFYSIFGAVLKEGFHFDHENHETLADIVRFRSNRTGPTGWVSLKEYTDRKADNQQHIFFLTGPSYDAIANSPHLEAFKARGIEVLFLTDAIDEWFVMEYPRHGECDLKNITKGDVDISNVGTTPEAQPEPEMPADTLSGVLEDMRKALTEHVKDVRVSHRLTESPCCLVAEDSGLTPQMERLMKMSNKDWKPQKRILEVNPNHNLIKNLATLKSSGASEGTLQDWMEVLYDTALVAEGSQPANPGEYARRVVKLLAKA